MAKKDKTQKQALEATQTADIAWLQNQWQELRLLPSSVIS